MFKSGEILNHFPQLSFAGHQDCAPKQTMTSLKMLFRTKLPFWIFSLYLPSCKGSCFVLLRFSSKCLTEDAPRITASETTKWMWFLPSTFGCLGKLVQFSDCFIKIRKLQMVCSVTLRGFTKTSLFLLTIASCCEFHKCAKNSNRKPWRQGKTDRDKQNCTLISS